MTVLREGIALRARSTIANAPSPLPDGQVHSRRPRGEGWWDGVCEHVPVDWAADRRAPGRKASLDVERARLRAHEAGHGQGVGNGVEEIGDIRRDEHPASGRESPCQVAGKGRRGETALVMAPLPPGIGKIEMVRGDAAVRDEPSHDAAGVAAEDPRVRQGGLVEGRAGGVCKPDGTLEADEIALWCSRGRRAQKVSAATADLHLDGVIVAEDGAPRDRLSVSGRSRPRRLATLCPAVEDAVRAALKTGDAGSGHESIDAGVRTSGVSTALRAKKSIAF